MLMLGGRHESIQCDATLEQELGLCSLSEKHGKPRCRPELRSVGRSPECEVLLRHGGVRCWSEGKCSHSDIFIRSVIGPVPELHESYSPQILPPSNNPRKIYCPSTFAGFYNGADGVYVVASIVCEGVSRRRANLLFRS